MEKLRNIRNNLEDSMDSERFDFGLDVFIFSLFLLMVVAAALM